MISKKLTEREGWEFAAMSAWSLVNTIEQSLSLSELKNIVDGTLQWQTINCPAGWDKATTDASITLCLNKYTKHCCQVGGMKLKSQEHIVEVVRELAAEAIDNQD